MFRRRLTLVLLLLAAAVVLQGVAAVFAVREAERQVVRGRVASDILQRFVDLSATKQRLRSWVTQHQIGAGGDLAERDALEQRMNRLIDELGGLTQEAANMGMAAQDAAEQVARLDALQVLGRSMQTLGEAIRQKPPLGPDTQARQAWDALTAVFEVSDGRDLRQLIAESIEREKAAMVREREAADVSLARMRALWMGTALALALGALAATFYFGRGLRRPLHALAEGAQALQQGQLQHRIDLPGRDEFADVAHSMNAMAEELESHRQREQEQRQLLEATVRERTADLHQANESLRRTDVRRRQLLADISHELRTPTTAIRGEAEVTLRGADRPAAEYREALGRIVDTSRQLAAVIDDLLAMARTDMETLSLVRQPVSIKRPLLDALGQAAALAGEHGVGLLAEERLPPRRTVFGDAQRLTQLLLLLLDNAVRYSLPGGVVRWRVSNQGDWLVLEVKDQGIGIPPQELSQIFERHFRGEVARRHRASGSGLGLPIARALAQAHGGTLEISSQFAGPDAAGSTTAVLRLPLWPDDRPVSDDSQPAPLAEGSRT
jgi:signal transduction histidine kinase